MMFLFAVPVMEAFGVYLVPLMVGTRNIAFPRLNAFNYWLYLFGGCFLWIAFLLQEGPDVGWFAYVPLSLLQYTPTKQADVWAQMITFTEVAALAVAVEIITTVFKLRAPGMTLDRIPIFVWSMLVTSFLVVFAMPSIMVSPRRRSFWTGWWARTSSILSWEAMCCCGSISSGSSATQTSTLFSCPQRAWSRQ
jgi:cytochrome c oxidase subunit 1